MKFATTNLLWLRESPVSPGGTASPSYPSKPITLVVALRVRARGPTCGRDDRKPRTRVSDGNVSWSIKLVPRGHSSTMVAQEAQRRLTLHNARVDLRPCGLAAME